ncbi:MAG: hypothetical protein GX896_01530 [Clostridiales bacterium]|nr:hypothetical protein [Clostridiales bacterium]
MKKYLTPILLIVILVVLVSFLIIYNLNNKDTNSNDSNTKSESTQSDSIDVSKLVFSVKTNGNFDSYIISSEDIKQEILDEMENITINNLNISEEDIENPKGGEQYYLDITYSDGENFGYLGLILSSKANIQIDDDYYNVSPDIKNKLIELLKNK